MGEGKTRSEAAEKAVATEDGQVFLVISGYSRLVWPAIRYRIRTCRKTNLAKSSCPSGNVLWCGRRSQEGTGLVVIWVLMPYTNTKTLPYLSFSVSSLFAGGPCGEGFI